MDSIRRLHRKTCITKVVLGVFVLWSSMVVCLLPDLAHNHQMQADAHVTVHADCLDNSSQTFCKSEARNGMLPDLAKLASIDLAPVARLADVLVYAPPALIVWTEPTARPPLIYLIVCRFLK